MAVLTRDLSVREQTYTSETFSDVLDLSEEIGGVVAYRINVSALTGDFTLTPQWSLDNENWSDLDPTTFSVTGTQVLVTEKLGGYLRFKFTPTTSVTLTLIAKVVETVMALNNDFHAKTAEQYRPGYEDNDAQRAVTEERWNYETITTATTTTIVTGPGVIGSIKILGGTTGNVTGYDNNAASGTTFIPTVSVNQGEELIGRPLRFFNGVTIVTAAATVIQIAYRAD